MEIYGVLCILYVFRMNIRFLIILRNENERIFVGNKYDKIKYFVFINGKYI